MARLKKESQAEAVCIASAWYGDGGSCPCRLVNVPISVV